MFITSIANINKALQVKTYIDPRQKLPSHFCAYVLVFNQKVSKTLPPYYKPRVNHGIKLEKDKEGQEPKVL